MAIGIALDCIYSCLTGLLSSSALNEILTLLNALKFKLFVPQLLPNSDNTSLTNPLFQGLNEFREHLGGELTIMLLNDIGEGVEVHDIEQEKMHQALLKLKQFEENLTNAAEK